MVMLSVPPIHTACALASSANGGDMAPAITAMAPAGISLAKAVLLFMILRQRGKARDSPREPIFMHRVTGKCRILSPAIVFSASPGVHVRLP